MLEHQPTRATKVAAKPVTPSAPGSAGRAATRRARRATSHVAHHRAAIRKPRTVEPVSYHRLPITEHRLLSSTPPRPWTVFVPPKLLFCLAMIQPETAKPASEPRCPAKPRHLDRHPASLPALGSKPVLNPVIPLTRSLCDPLRASVKKNGRLASWLVVWRPLRVSLASRASPSGHFLENRTPRNFRAGSNARSSFVPILFQFCTDAVPILYRFCTGSVPALYQLCTSCRPQTLESQPTFRRAHEFF